VLAPCDGLSDGNADIRVQHRLVVVGAVVLHSVALGDKMLLDGFFEVASGLVTANGYFHGVIFVIAKMMRRSTKVKSNDICAKVADKNQGWR